SHLVTPSLYYLVSLLSIFFFFFTDPATTEIYTLSLHDALPISGSEARALRKSFEIFRSSGSSMTFTPNFVQARSLRYGFAGWKPDRKSTRLNSSHLVISYAVFCLKKKKNKKQIKCKSATRPHFQ